VLQWMLASGALLWQIGDILSRPSWTSKSFRFQNFIELFEKQQQKVKLSIRENFNLEKQDMNLIFFRRKVGSLSYTLVRIKRKSVLFKEKIFHLIEN